MWSFSIGSIWGIKVRVHVLFLAFIGILSLLTAIEHGFVTAFIYFIFMALVFSFVFVHELGHCVVARHFSIAVKDITLWPFGGIATMENLTIAPAVELRIAIAGPLVNLGLALLLSPIAIVTYLGTHSLFFIDLVVANLILMLFNLLPAFPLDGGRIYRSWQADRVGFREATRRTVSSGMVMAVLLCLLGIVYPWCFVIAIIVVLAGRQELAMSEDVEDMTDQI